MTDSTGWSAPDPHGAGSGGGASGGGPPGGGTPYPRYPTPEGPGRGDAGKPGVIPLRPLAFGEILDGAITTMRRHAAVVFGSSAVVALLGAVLYFAADLWLLGATEPAPVIDENASPERQLDQAVAALEQSLPGMGVIALISLLTQTFLSGLLTVVVGKAVLGQAISVGQAWEELRPRLLPLFGLTVVVTLAVAVGTLFLVLPGIWLYVLLSLATPALILERGRVGQALGRSRTLVRGSWWRVFGVLLVALALTMIIGSIIQIPFGFAVDADAVARGMTTGELLITEVGNAVAQTITVPFASAVTALLYIDQRMRKEGLDIELSRAAGTR
ncbi:hypothetical protein [Saccharomonospora saliphila]|uniref:hypothetical protein n=1 Tax=Saccharomonospora saliphila TaxID=369829 RepID=UPI00037DDEAA|nr:hypothetical protein [Saccharomonospora saliphila]